MKTALHILRVFFVVLMPATLFAQGPPQTPPGHERYIVVLKSGRDFTDDDAGRFGATVRLRGRGVVVVTLPAAAARNLRQHASVKYIQRSSLPLSAPLAVDPSPATEGAPPASTPRATPLSDHTSWDSGTYKYDESGNIYAIGTPAEPGTDGTQWSYAYDMRSRLKSAKIASGGATTTRTMEYDDFGNLTALGGQTIDVDASTNRLTTDSGAAYDAAGNMTQLGSEHTYVYDGLGQLMRKTEGSRTEYYVYDANDERIAVRSDDDAFGKFVWTLRDDDGSILRQYSSQLIIASFVYQTDWLWLEDYVYRGGGSLLASQRPIEEGGRRHYHLDHLGTPRLVTGEGGYWVAQHDYAPYGEEITSMRQDVAKGYDREEPHRFTAHERDFSGGTAAENTNYVDYMHARYYTASTGRFLTVDNFHGDLLLPLTWNRFAYAYSNPLSLIDPDGKEPVNPVIAAIASLMNGQKAAFPIRVHAAWWLGKGTAASIFGHDIFISTKPVGPTGRIPWNDYQAVNFRTMIDMTHEYQHVLQAERMTGPGLSIAYFGTLLYTAGYNRTSYFEAPAYLVEAKAGVLLKQYAQVTGDTAWMQIITHFDPNYFRPNFDALVGQGQIIEGFLNGTLCIDGTCLHPMGNGRYAQ